MGQVFRLSTVNLGYPLTDGAQLLLTVGVMADRTKTRYGDIVVPDEVISDQSEAVQRAVAWIRGARARARPGLLPAIASTDNPASVGGLPPTERRVIRRARRDDDSGGESCDSVSPARSCRSSVS